MFIFDFYRKVSLTIYIILDYSLTIFLLLECPRYMQTVLRPHIDIYYCISWIIKYYTIIDVNFFFFLKIFVTAIFYSKWFSVVFFAFYLTVDHSSIRSHIGPHVIATSLKTDSWYLNAINDNSMLRTEKDVCDGYDYRSDGYGRS